MLNVYLDVDGVLNAVYPNTPPCWAWPRQSEVLSGEHLWFNVRYSPDLIDRLNTFAALDHVQMHWLTTWCERAPRTLAEPIGLTGATEWPVVGAAEMLDLMIPNDVWWKHVAIKAHLAEHQPEHVLWIDDDIRYDAAARQWITDTPNVLGISPNTNFGISPTLMDKIDAYAQETAP